LTINYNICDIKELSALKVEKVLLAPYFNLNRCENDMQINNRIETSSTCKLNKRKNKRHEIIVEMILQKREGFIRYIPVTIIFYHHEKG
jgi:hypothetical protein